MTKYKIYQFYKSVIKGGQFDWLPLDFGFVCDPCYLPAIKWSEFLDIISCSPKWIKQHLKIYEPKDASELDLRTGNMANWQTQDAVDFYGIVLQMLNCFLYTGKDAPSFGVDFLEINKNLIAELWENIDGGKEYLFDIFAIFLNTKKDLDQPIIDEDITSIFTISGKNYILPTWAIEEFSNKVLPIYLKNPEILTFRQGVEALAIQYGYSEEESNLLRGKAMKKNAYIDEITGLLASLLVEIRLIGFLGDLNPAKNVEITLKHKKIQNFEYVGDRFAKELYQTENPTPDKQSHWAARLKERKKVFFGVTLKEAQKVVFFLAISLNNLISTQYTNSYLQDQQSIPKLRQKSL